MRIVRAAVLAAASVTLMAGAPASAQDTLKIAIGQINNWENQALFDFDSRPLPAMSVLGAG